MSEAARCTPLRQSCDRCHHQKLRCARRNNSTTEACERCLQRQIPCIYSSSLPKGRPGIYSKTLSKEPPSIHLTKRITHKPTAKKVPKVNSKGVPTLISPPVDGTLFEAAHQQIASTGPECNSVGSCTPHAPDANLSELEMNADGWITQEDTEIAQSSADSLMWPLTVDLLVMDASDSDLAPLASEHGPRDADNIHQIHEAIELSLDALPNSWADDSAEWDNFLIPDMDTCMQHSTRNGDSTPPSRSVTGVALESPRLSLDTEAPTNSTGSQTPLDGYNPSTIISLLSQLNARIASMQCFIDKVVQAADASAATEAMMTKVNNAGEANTAIHQKSRPTRLLDDAALGSAATWLMRQKHRRSDFFPRPDDYSEDPQLHSSIPQDIFSASNHFLELLECVSNSSSTPALDTTRDKLNETIRHLNIACHLLLIGIYETLLAVMEHDALLEKQTASAVNYQGPLGQIQLASVVQLCSYIFARQNQAIDTYLSKAQQQQQQQHRHDGDGGCSRATIDLDKQVISSFADELQKRFQRLECILGFSNCV